MPTLVEPTSLLLDIILNSKDFAYLYSLLDEDTLWLFPYFVPNLQGIALPDTGATRNYISRAFVLQANLSIEQFDIMKHVSLAGGQKMAAYGKCKVPVQMSDWQGEIEAIVIDLNAEFNLILGLNWHRQMKAVTHWGTMIMEITDLKKQRHSLAPYPWRLGTLGDLSDFECNTISFRGAMNALNNNLTQSVLYFVH